MSVVYLVCQTAISRAGSVGVHSAPGLPRVRMVRSDCRVPYLELLFSASVRTLVRLVHVWPFNTPSSCWCCVGTTLSSWVRGACREMRGKKMFNILQLHYTVTVLRDHESSQVESELNKIE